METYSITVNGEMGGWYWMEVRPPLGAEYTKKLPHHDKNGVDRAPYVVCVEVEDETDTYTQIAYSEECFDSEEGFVSLTQDFALVIGAQVVDKSFNEDLTPQAIS